MSTRPRIDRRRFLQSAACGLAAAALPPSTRPALADQPQQADGRANKTAAVDFGFSLYGMRSMTTDEALKVCADIGYDSVELVAADGWPCDPLKLSRTARQQVRTQLDDLGLRLSSLMENLILLADDIQHARNLERLQAAFKLAHDLAPDNPPVVETILGGRPQQWPQVKDEMSKRLAEWGTVAEREKTVLAVKAHVGGALHTPEDALWIVEQARNPWIRLTYDYSHFQLRNLSLEQSLESMVGQTAFIHVKDAAGTADKFEFLLPGDGTVDYARYFELLKSCGYRGSVIVEVSGQIHSKPGYDPIAAARHSYKNLAPFFSKAGLRTKP